MKPKWMNRLTTPQGPGVQQAPGFPIHIGCVITQSDLTPVLDEHNAVDGFVLAALQRHLWSTDDETLHRLSGALANMSAAIAACIETSKNPQLASLAAAIRRQPSGRSVRVTTALVAAILAQGGQDDDR